MNEQDNRTDETTKDTPSKEVEVVVETDLEKVEETTTEATGEKEEVSTDDAPKAEDATTENPIEDESNEEVKEKEEEKTTTSDSETQPVSSSDVETVAAAAAIVSPVDKLKSVLLAQKYTILAVIVVAITMLGLTYMMEKQGRLHTGLFDGVDKILATKKTVAKVNDGKITQKDLDISITQISAGAAAQGADVADPEFKAEIQKQAVDMLVNTELLKQEATSRGIVITDEAVNARLEQLKTDVGGEEELTKRMQEFNIDEKTLVRDIRNELTIQALLDQVFTEKSTEVTEEEIKQLYDKAGGEKAGLPKLEEVREKIVAQIKSSKEQEIVTTFIEELRSKATIEVLI